MIGTVILTELRVLFRSPVDLLLVFIVPIVFFSIFGAIFGSQGERRATPRIEIAIANPGPSELGRTIADGLEKDAGTVVFTEEDGSTRVSPERAEELVRKGEVQAAIVIPADIEEGFLDFGPGPRPAVRILSDQSDPIAPQIVSGLLQKASFTGGNSNMAARGAKILGSAIGGFDEQTQARIDGFIEQLDRMQFMNAGSEQEEDATGPSMAASPLAIEVIDVLGEEKENPTVAYYAAAIAVMFLLFSATGAGGSLLDEEQAGTLERTLSTPLGMGRLLLGKWLFLTLMGVVQVIVMFTWGQLVFSLDFLGNLPGFFAMTIPTAAAASGFGLVLATACRSRSQLSGVSTIVILTMSALGGSMFPRFLMPEGMQTLGLFTFNSWALDGYVKVFWRNEPIAALAPQLAVLIGMAIVFFIASRLLARRWETR